MVFDVKWLRGDRVVAVRNFRSFEEAARDAEQLLPTYAKMFDATAVEVWDRNGFRHLTLEAGEAA